LEEAVRPCLRCDALVVADRSYCQKCGTYLGAVSLVISRPAAAAPSGDGAALQRAFVGILGACALLALACAAAALAGSL
jgi:hypothetical protein